MKILYVYKSIALLAGMERVLTDKMNYLADQLGYDIYLITYEQGVNPLSYPLSPRIKYKDLGVLFYTKSRYSFPKRFWIYRKMRNDFRQKFYEEVRRINPDIIISTNYSFQILDLIIRAPGNSKHLLEAHIAKSALLKSADFASFSPFKVATYFYDWYMVHHIKKFDILVTLTEQDRKKWENTIQTVAIPNVLTLYPADAAELTNKYLISAGRYDDQKGYDLLIQAWNLVAPKHPDWQMHIYGDGPLKSSLQSMIEKYGLASSFILNPATPDIYDKYFEHSIYVMSSRFEGFGLVLIEAMSCGLPCISFDCPSGPSEIIKNGEDGILVENGNIEKLSEAICCLIEDEQKRKQMGAKARKNILRYSKENIMQQWDILFKRLI
ncbi:glycosyltransferase family 4 protein [Bacteroides sp. GD17]|jgi:glycosyltransferase involved in cell wall biosynthesis|uniref:glycosyltransferase family 4 protein n=1 Tax=Bacteroides sp. GD17 TaxID=3139826 RepID=UPI0025FAFCB4|nr:glycosyltransferase family 4 protein [uncultured Bacteroides sp.]